jgi:hypothetical protein
MLCLGFHACAGKAYVLTLCGLLLALLLVGCGQGGPASLSLDDVFPAAGTVSGWAPAGEVQVFDRENLYDLVDGQADAFFAYRFGQVAVRDYGGAEGAALRVEVWQLATPGDAYGLFTAQLSGTPVAIGNDGDADHGRRLAFWQNRYVVQLRARQEIPDADLWDLGRAVSAALPPGGERPALVGRLPPEGLVERSVLFFHEEISIQDELWLGGENLLGLGPETDGALARYDVDGGEARLLLVQYPDVEAASVAMEALAAGGFDTLALTDARGDVLGAVFGEIDAAAAAGLLERALGGRP